MLVGTKAIAKYLDVSPTTIYRWIEEEYIPCIKLGGQYKFSLEVIDRWVKDQ